MLPQRLLCDRMVINLKLYGSNINSYPCPTPNKNLYLHSLRRHILVQIIWHGQHARRKFQCCCHWYSCYRDAGSPTLRARILRATVASSLSSSTVIRITSSSPYWLSHSITACLCADCHVFSGSPRASSEGAVRDASHTLSGLGCSLSVAVAVAGSGNGGWGIE